MVESFQPKGREFESAYVLGCFCFVLIRLTSFLIHVDVPRPLSNVLWIVIFKRLMRNAYTEQVCQLQNRIIYVIKRLKPLFLDPNFQFL